MSETATGADRLSRDEAGLAGAPIPAANAVERCLLELWTATLRIEGLGVADDFFQAGGDSLAAVSLCAGIERDLGVALPISILLTAPTPRLLARAVTAAQAGLPPGCLMQIRAGRSPAAMFVHGLLGDMVIARTFLPFLDDGRRIHGIRARGLAGGEAPLRSVEEMAEHYLREVLEVEPSGPYLLAGSCGGSLVAYEMAQHLARRGAAVPGVALIDPPVEPNFVPWLYGAPPRPLPARAAAGWRGNGARRLNNPRQLQVAAALAAALGAYVPKPYRGRLLVIHSMERGERLRDPAVGWPRYARAGIEFAAVATDHDGVFDTGLHATASFLQTFFDRVAPAEGRADTK